MSFRLANVDDRAVLVDSDDNYYDLATISRGDVGPDLMEAIGTTARLHELDAGLSSHEPAGQLADAVLGAPVPRPRNSFGIGLNYAGHVAEGGGEIPESPVIFTKFPSCIVGPNSDVVLNSTAADYEAELVVVIGAGCRNVSRDAAWDHIAGVTGGQDISDRALQFAAKPPHFDMGKSRDTYGPTGPVLVSPDPGTRRPHLHRHARRRRHGPGQAAEAGRRDHDDDRGRRHVHQQLSLTAASTAPVVSLTTCRVCNSPVSWPHHLRTAAPGSASSSRS